MSHKIITLPKTLEILFNLNETYNHLKTARDIVNDNMDFYEYYMRLNLLETKIKSLLDDFNSEYKYAINVPDEIED